MSHIPHLLHRLTGTFFEVYYVAGVARYGGEWRAGERVLAGFTVSAMSECG
jgi:hypothetical protein